MIRFFRTRMKYALQLYGQLRTFQRSLPSLLYFIDYFNKDYDVFLFIDKGDGSTYTNNKGSNYSEENIELLFDLLIPERIKSCMFVDEMSQSDKEKEEVLTSEYYALWKRFNDKYGDIPENYFVTKLKYRTYILNRLRLEYEEKHKIVYDYVVRSRFDWGTTYTQAYEINLQTTPIVFADTLTIGSPEFVNKEAELGLVYPYTPKCLFDDNCNLLIDKYNKFSNYKGYPYLIQKMWLFFPEYNLRTYLLDNGLSFIDAHWESPSNYDFKIIR
jgi:hypothetical protein